MNAEVLMTEITSTKNETTSRGNDFILGSICPATAFFHTPLPGSITPPLNNDILLLAGQVDGLLLLCATYGSLRTARGRTRFWQRRINGE